VSSDLQAVLPALHPAHGLSTWFRVYRRQLNALFRLAFASAAPQNGLTLLTTVSRRIIMQKARRQAFPLAGAWPSDRL